MPESAYPSDRRQRRRRRSSLTCRVLVSPAAAEPLAGYEEAKPMVFCGLYPTDAEEYEVGRRGTGPCVLFRDMVCNGQASALLPRVDVRGVEISLGNPGTTAVLLLDCFKCTICR